MNIREKLNEVAPWPYTRDDVIAVDIGQLSKSDILQLNALVKEGKAVKAKCYWPGIVSGTIKKTYWFKTERARHGLL